MNYKSIALITISIILMLSTTSCATMFCKNKHAVAINTQPQGADIVVKKTNGTIMFQGTSPAAPLLPAGDDLGRALYVVTATYPGYKTQSTNIQYKVNGVYYLNLLLPIFGWFIGMPFVDPATGAMFKPSDKNINIVLEEGTDIEEKEGSLYEM